MPDALPAVSEPIDSSRHPIDLNTLLSSLERLLRPRLGQAVSLRLELAAGAAWVEGDPGQLTQVLLDSAGRALDGMPAPGQLLLRCEARPGTGGGAPIVAGPHVRITIRAGGPLVPPEAQQTVKDPSGPPRLGGIGLGRAVVEELVRGHGGAVEYRSGPGQGARIVVLLPARQVPAGASVPVVPGAAVVVLDRNPDIRQLAGMILAHGRYTPVLCGGFHEARQLSHHPERPIRLLLVDAELCSGRREEELAELLACHPTARLLYTSAGDRVPLGAPGVPPPCGIVLKPFRAEQLLRAVEAALSG
jgi:hypothetical protein